MGCDLQRSFRYTQQVTFQSTHPGWGATSTYHRRSELACYFNPRTPGGVRRCLITLYIYTPHHFNPRTPGGVRLGELAEGLYHGNFNPRTPGGVRRRVVWGA